MDFLSEVERQLDLPPAEKAQVIRELKSHYLEMRDELLAAGTDPAEAEREAARRLGEPADIASRMQQVHCRATWKSAFLAAVPLLASILVLEAFGMYHLSRIMSSIIAMLALAALFGGVAIRELALDRRPVWLPTWLACGLFALQKTAPALITGLKPALPVSVVAVTAVWLALPIAVALLVCWKSPKWRATAIAVSIAAAVVSIYSVCIDHPVPIVYRLLWLSIGSLPDVALWTMIALKVFADHRHGSVTHASLFLFAYFAMAWSRISFVFARGSDYTLLHTFVPPLLLAAVAVLVYARASTWRDKIAVLISAIVLSHIYNVWQESGALHWVVFSVVVTAVQLGAVVLAPLFYGRLAVESRPDFAR
ncbi:MAG: hypothetical protein A2Z18_02690 [Armatimonadetes bacterium RBG_16_58_9]|nr:MAG: hypothetical protein A2Z18_02690 [Armatimonadetes bacterium RBG_16_58_9]